MRILSTAVSIVVLTSSFYNGDCFQPSNGIQRGILHSLSSQRLYIERVRTNGMNLYSTSSDLLIQEKKGLKGKPIHAQKTKTKTNKNNAPKRKPYISKPWKANFATSTITQQKIKSAAKMRASPIVRASTILKTFLHVDPTHCNPSNLVCALTLSAKIVPKNAQRRHEFRHLLHQTLDILSDLVKKNQLNTRQLANVAWAIAKHYCSDELIIPPVSASAFDKSASVSFMQGEAGDASTVSLSEMWDLEEDTDGEDEYPSERRVLETLENIADQLMDTMSMSMDGQEENSFGKKDMNEVEMSMVCWAYAVLYPRNVPTGWELPPRVGQMEKLEKEAMERISDNNNDNDNDNPKKDTMTFETVQDMTDRSDTRMEEEFIATSFVDRLFDAMAETIVRQQKDGLSMIQICGWKELSTITWSYANRGYCQSNAALDLILHIADAAIARIEKASWVRGCGDILPRDLSEIAWALGVMQSDNYYLSNSLEDFITVINNNLVENGSDRPLKNWKSADCVQMAIALGHGRLDRQFLLKEIYGEALRSIKEGRINQYNDGNQKQFQDFELVVLLWVQARLYLTKELGEIFDDFAEIVPGKLLYRMHMADSASSKSLEDIQTGFDRIHLGAQQQANLAWSLTVLEKYNSRDSIDILRCIFNVCSASCNDRNFIRVEHGHQLWQSIFILDQECPEAIEGIDEQTFKFLKNMWDQEKSRHKTSSARHRALSETLNFMGVKHYNEHDEDIDLALVLKTDSKWTHSAENCDDENGDYKQRVAVEFDGPSHFTKIEKTILGKKPNKPRALGHTVLKYKILKNQGWTTVRIPFYEFDRIPFWASMERQRYVQRKLKTHSNLQFSGVDVSEYKAPLPNRKSRFD